MIGWLQLTNAQRKTAIDTAEQQSGIQAKAIEKDWYVTLVLKALFQSKYAQYIVFKGGTSLSKGWKLIARFSEDIDIALDPQAFNMKYIENPSRREIQDLKRAGCDFTSHQLKDEIEQQLAVIGVPAGLLAVEAAPVPEKVPDTDPQTIYIKYKSLYDSNPYIADEVKVEVSVRSVLAPSETIQMQSLLHEFNPNSAYTEVPFSVETVVPRKTFFEKVFLLHEEFNREGVENIKTERKSRHLYDLYKASLTEVLNEALNDHELYDHLIVHRSRYNKMSGVSFDLHAHPTIAFIPGVKVLDAYKSDYQSMLEQMIYEENPPSFDDIILHLKLVQGKFRLKRDNKTFEEITERARQDILSKNEIAGQQITDGAFLTVLVLYLSNPEIAAGPDNESVTYEVSFGVNNGGLIFENIRKILD